MTILTKMASFMFICACGLYYKCVPLFFFLPMPMSLYLLLAKKKIKLPRGATFLFFYVHFQSLQNIQFCAWSRVEKCDNLEIIITCPHPLGLVLHFGLNKKSLQLQHGSQSLDLVHRLGPNNHNNYHTSIRLRFNIATEKSSSRTCFKTVRPLTADE